MGKKKQVEDIKAVVLVCHGSDCKKKGAKGLAKAARGCLRELGHKRSALVVRTKCNGFCKKAPLVSLQPQNAWVVEADEKGVIALLKEHLDD